MSGRLPPTTPPPSPSKSLASSFQSSPIKPNLSGIGIHDSESMSAKQFQLASARDMSGHWIGAVEPGEFMNTLMKTRQLPPRRISRVSFNSLPKNPAIERDIYLPFIEIVNSSILKGTGLKLVNSSSTPQAVNGVKLAPDVCMCLVAMSSQDDNSEKAVDSEWRWVVLEMWIEFKRLANQDPFRQDYDNLDMFLEKITNEELEEVRGQLVSYAAAQMARQHRKFIFSLLICGDNARFIRWDHTGATVSKHFDIRQKPAILAEFLWRYTQLDNPGQGKDPTVCNATPEEESRLAAAVNMYRNSNDRNPLTLLNVLDSDYCCYKITVSGSDNGSERCDYIVQRPFSDPLSILGRSTRTYVALNSDTEELELLPDYWRTIGPESLETEHPPESAIYQELKSANVPHLPCVVLSGDVTDEDGTVQATVTQTYADKPDMCKSEHLKEYRHYRIVLELVVPLSAAKDSKELAGAVGNAVRCIVLSHRAGWMHRDVGTRNVMLDRYGNGILCSWDLGLKIVSERIAAYSREGTWQFISIRIATDPSRIHDVIDDLESCYWVLLYTAIRHVEGTAQRENLRMFDERNENSRVKTTGGTKKTLFLLQMEMVNLTVPLKFNCTGLHNLLESLRLHLRSLYLFNNSPGLAQSRRDTVSILDIFESALAGKWCGHCIIEDRFPRDPNAETTRHKPNLLEHQQIVTARTGISTTLASGSQSGLKRSDRTDEGGNNERIISAAKKAKKPSTAGSSSKRSAPKKSKK
ncbi:hypothetical protein BXZ70DRAFT_907775 [Cristinia sonorae]|uniref:Fungal-type protein kinase domain-containing protein n=1 Tax=Cristinia sonorae TaxID=1940300 RepID=A0A8K0UMP7_9AGAR|nr:hypothetical protein BXZ70DRAFT_907775 [Cristinia sonorae]